MFFLFLNYIMGLILSKLKFRYKYDILKDIIDENFTLDLEDSDLLVYTDDENDTYD